MKKLVNQVRGKMDHILSPFEARANLPQKLLLAEFFEQSKKKDAFVFLGLHWGEGENGHIQAQLDAHSLQYNGSGPQASALCMDKYLTGQRIQELNHPSIRTAFKLAITAQELQTIEDFTLFFNKLVRELNSNCFIVKPSSYRCSSLVVKLMIDNDL